MAVTISNIQHNHRGLYFEAVGDGATTALTVAHGGRPHTNTTAVATVLTGGTNFDRHSGKGGFIFPSGGTPVAVSSVQVTATNVTVNTSAAVGNGTKAFVAVVFDQPSAA